MNNGDKNLLIGLIVGLSLGVMSAYSFISVPEVVTVAEIKIECYTQTIKANNSLLHRVKCPRVVM